MKFAAKTPFPGLTTKRIRFERANADKKSIGNKYTARKSRDAGNFSFAVRNREYLYIHTLDMDEKLCELESAPFRNDMS